LGALLSKGTRSAAAEIGGIAPEFAVHVKGLEVPMHDPRAFYAMAANYMTANRGACHLESLAYTLGYGRTYEGLGLPEQFVNDSGSAALIGVITQNFFGLFNPLGICKFVARAGFSVNEISRWLELTSGLCLTPAELLKTGERIYNEKRILNVGLGVSRKDDMLPPRLISKRRGSGRAAENLPDAGSILSDYYKLRGWNEFGIPAAKKCEELGIDFKP
ncbi:MAG TPA: aldehyde ferredoxin oxidoreductase C-terminal domain-containing protein, partial [Candidatus Wallbacteria bacterium]|nr:aldehyde ferredoxin oxidoreductase C-terminal domain-containing protein [Candidatus Wallbacteria bacterium]